MLLRQIAEELRRRDNIECSGPSNEAIEAIEAAPLTTLIDHLAEFDYEDGLPEIESTVHRAMCMKANVDIFKAFTAGKERTAVFNVIVKEVNRINQTRI